MRLGNSYSTDRKNAKHQLQLSIYDVLSESTNLGLSIYLSIISNSMICWVDNLVSISAVLRSIIVLVIFIKIFRRCDDKYNYGVGRLEALISFICDSLVVLAMIGMFGTAIYSIVNPTLPTDNLFKFLILKIVNLTFDASALTIQYRICKKENNRLRESELQNYFINTVHDLTVGITVTLCYIFRNSAFSSYLSPIVSMIVISFFIYKCFKHIKGSFKELADISIPIDQQDYIFDTLLENKDTLKQIESVNCHILNHIVYVDISVKFKGNVTYDEQINFLDAVKKQVNQKIPDSIVRLVISSDN